VRFLRSLVPLALVAGLVTACGGGSSSSPQGATGPAVSSTVQLRVVSARYAQDTSQGQEQLGPQVPKALASTLSKYDCASKPTVIDGLLVECDSTHTVYLMNSPLITGGVASAVPLQIGHSKQWYVKLTFDPKATSALSKAADTMTGQELAIVLDGHVLTALLIDSSMKDGHVGITGDYDKSSATQLAQQLTA